VADEIEPDIRDASTPPGAFYADPALLERARERVFARSWQLVDADEPSRQGAAPFTLLPGFLDEPLLLARDSELRCLSNVCTHRGSTLVDAPCETGALRCRYHGRRFALDGRMLSAPEFEGARGFPSSSDDLPRVALVRHETLVFASLDPAVPFDDWIRPVRERAGFLPLARAVRDRSRDRAYTVRAHWALYCDNYLEGLHVPFVHESLAKVVSFPDYRTELFDHASLQTGFAAPGEDAIEPPPGNPDHGRRVAGWWFFLFPNTMLNFYPWGVSVNVVVPQAPDVTKVLYSAWVWDGARLGKGAGGDLDRVEREDEAVVEAVQRGVRSRLYRRGRYSPSRETGVHHFHRMLTRLLAD
jgi:choline monooxygenase